MNNHVVRAAAPDLFTAADAALPAILAVQLHFDCGLIPLLQHLRQVHPDFAPEAVEQALYELMPGSDERDELDAARNRLRAAIAKADPEPMRSARKDAAARAVLGEIDRKRQTPGASSAEGES